MFKCFTKEIIVKDEKRESLLSSNLAKSQKNNMRLTNKVAKLQETIQEITKATEKIIQERDELRKMVRDQTRADLLINSLKAVGIIPDKCLEEKKEYFNRDLQLEAMRQRAATMNTQMPYSGPVAGALGALGSVF